jgi:taurine dioxygenase
MVLTVTKLNAALGATVTGIDTSVLDADGPGLADDTIATLRRAWSEHLVLFFPEINLSPTQQVRLAGYFGDSLAATTETGDYRNAPTLANEGFPQILLLDTGTGHKPTVTSNWHTDVTFVPNPPIGSLFCMEIPAPHGGDTMFIDQYRSLESLSRPVQEMISALTAVHGRPPLTESAEHPMVITHPETGRRCLFVNRGWTAKVKGVSTTESNHLLAMLFERAEQPEHTTRWQWTAGDAALWDNRCTMHYALNDYNSARRRARRVTIYQGQLANA